MTLHPAVFAAGRAVLLVHPPIELARTESRAVEREIRLDRAEWQAGFRDEPMEDRGHLGHFEVIEDRIEVGTFSIYPLACASSRSEMNRRPDMVEKTLNATVKIMSARLSRL